MTTPNNSVQTTAREMNTVPSLSVEPSCNQRRAAQHGAGADAAVRPEDRRYFESWNQPDCLAGLAVRRSSAPSRWAAAHHAPCPMDVRYDTLPSVGALIAPIQENQTTERSMLQWPGVEKGSRTARLIAACLLLLAAAGCSFIGYSLWREFAPRVPLYPHAQDIENDAHYPIDDQASRMNLWIYGYRLTFRTSDPAPSVAAFYQATLPQSGWEPVYVQIENQDHAYLTYDRKHNQGAQPERLVMFVSREFEHPGAKIAVSIVIGDLAPMQARYSIPHS
jgi:hypothetical protein